MSNERNESRDAPPRATSRRFGWSHPTMLAPMEGVTHPTFRAMAAERGGVGILCTEFVRISRAPLDSRRLRDEVVKVPGVPLSVQVMGNDAEKMAEAARVVSDAGADVVDINLGCPMPRVVRKGVGAAMLEDLDLLSRVLERMRRATPGLLSAKIRAGFDDASKAVGIARTVEAAGVDFITVHPRRRADFYAGVADWRIVRELVRACQIPIMGNGDVWYASDVARMQRETGCQAVMIGRPAMRNPWIFEQAADLAMGLAPRRPSGADLYAHLVTVLERYRIELGYLRRGPTGKLKELCNYCVRAVVGHEEFIRDVLRQPDADSMLRVLEPKLAPLPPEQLDLTATPERGLQRSGSIEGGKSRAA